MGKVSRDRKQLQEQGYVIKKVNRANKIQARVYLPSQYIGKEVKIILIEDKLQI